jgi:RHH-type rel operon transcriptional repressor/antitoxin RelB
MLAIRLPESIESRLEKLAAKTGRTKSYYVREAILNQLDDLEDYYLAERRFAAIESGKTRTIPMAEMLKRYGLDVRVRSGRREESEKARPSDCKATAAVFV